MPREDLRCPLCGRFLAEVAPHLKNDLRIPCQRCKSDVFLQGLVISARPRPLAPKRLGDARVDTPVKISHVGG